MKGRVRTREIFDPPSLRYGATSGDMARSRPTRTKRAARRQKDMSASSFVLTLLLITTVGAATADHPTFWLLLGPAPLTALMGAVVFVRSRALQRSDSESVIERKQSGGVLECWSIGMMRSTMAEPANDHCSNTPILHQSRPSGY